MRDPDRLAGRIHGARWWQGIDAANARRELDEVVADLEKPAVEQR
ncbi:hypothetical protein [Symbioplanes lichenis]|nr:hypothetical protein [Actinoplanes lichenis]